MNEWKENPIFVSGTAKNSTIRERFGYYDENSDGWLMDNELYRTIRANQLRWKRFLIFWSKIDKTGDKWVKADEALDGLKEMIDPNFSKFQADEFIALFDRDGDGRVHQIQWWMQESKQWDIKRELEIAERAKRERFTRSWNIYDGDRDKLVSFEELRYVLDLL